MKSVLYMLFAFASCSMGNCQSYPAFPKTFSQNGDASTVGWFLEDNFQYYLSNSCQIQPMETSGNNPVSSVPVPIIKALGGGSGDSDAWMWVTRPKTYTAANAFAVLTADKSLPNNVDPNYLLPLDPLQDPETMLLEGTSYTLYTTNCTGIVAAAGSLDSNIKALFASLSAAAKADYTNSMTAELGLVRGDFNSPFLLMYGGRLGDASALFAHMTLWNWYRTRYDNTGSIPSGPFYLLHWFSGYTLYQVDKQARQTDGSINVSANVNYLGFISGSASLNGTYRNYGSTQIKSYRFGVDAFKNDPQKEDPQYLFETADTVDQIINWSKVQPEIAQFNALPNFSYVLRRGDQDGPTHEQVMAGLPQSLCNPNLWSINPGTSTAYGTLSLSPTPRLIAATSDQPPGCAFTVLFAPNDAAFNATTSTPVKLEYAFDTAIGDKKLEIKGSAVNFKTSPYPSLASDVGRAAVVAVGTNLQWDLMERVVSDPTLSQIDPVVSATADTDPTLSNCAAAHGRIGVPGDGVAPDVTGTMIKVRIQQDFSVGTFPDISKPEALTSCVVSLKLHLVMKSGKTADIDLPANTTIAYPVLTQPRFNVIQSVRSARGRL